MQRNLITAVLISSSAVSGCYASHLRPERDAASPPPLDAFVADAPEHDAGSRDAGRPTTDTGPCPHDYIIFPSCTPAELQMCFDRAWAQAAGAIPHVSCVQLGDTYATCAAADSCDSTGRCLCNASRICATNEVCVSDTPDGPTRCQRFCTAD